MAEILKGAPVAKTIKERIKSDAESLKQKGIIPTLGIIRMGNRADDISYEKGVIKNCESVGIQARVFKVPADTPMDEFVELLKKVNEDDNIHGILMFRPLPDHIDYEIIKNIIDPRKDVDCMNPINLEKVFEGELDGFVPCTPKAVVEILKHYNVPLVGASVAIINRSMVVGRPLSMMFLGESSTVTICHSKTKNLPEVTANADIVVAAVGKAKMLGKEYLSQNSIVIDVGINDAGEGKICGDVDYDNVAENVKAITPVPGGVGSVTSAILLSHVIIACKNIIK
ncbi:bifunctional 5,10-methylenetetrahydrofolate dehydrogenase/5,10-methenyltetrahydrofolate cyclohydrolase [Proteiniborus sp. MB09-C3]|uniref:bifunctional 5,10-methylenetetrahydrofolate dehydrogenase/5,10-methenyltetrahydrofolate cyclohydrolase n=1 Tax=Proteiniborus sp. MB09-C3 TaxID=3050072 RepID=UPI002555FF24|nr:bifunctional 5,10-methylenetetrahydrofolate dehydrogenase/5,10-methenyltetrahydrofolate cyclohydrolase [Proteiniborus sp. MB09-C3]WIV10715.1 bifunctional 5,10-methylenetetrahydrofolate dehydrogenase/5,10-methenyltetrahydrofolate cyclohydrolase [Proteiniborus sp. MB09-C3]